MKKAKVMGAIHFNNFLAFILISSSIILLHHHYQIIKHDQRSRDLVEIPEYPAILSAPMPSVGSSGYEAMAYLDILDTTDDRFYFMLHSRLEHIELSLKIESFELEQEMTDKLHEPPEPYHSSYFAEKNSNSAPEYSTIDEYDCYRSVEGSYQTMDFLSQEYPTLAETIEIGPSYLKSRKLLRGGHELQVLKVTNQDSTASKSPLFVTCGIHPRELTPPEVCARFAERILAGYGEDPDITWILDYTEIHILMQANPDGRENEEANLCRFRRKNMHADIDGCPGTRFGGVDLNRNFPHSAWGTVGVPQAPNFVKCRDNYQGTSAGSEKETQAIVNYMESVIPPGSNIIDDETGAFTADSKGVLIDMHAYGEDFFWPPNYKYNFTSPNEEGFKAMASKMSFLTGSLYSTHNDIYATSGDSTDYAYERLGIIAYTMELGTKFREPCSYFEQNILDNAINSLLYAARVSYAPFLLPKGPEVVSCNLSNDEPTTSDIIEIAIEVSDTRIVDNHTTAEQNITAISLYFDSHPYDVDAFPAIEINLNTSFAEISNNFTSSEEIVTFDFSLSDLGVGKHTLYVQAHDNDGPGPVYAKFLNIR